MFKSELCHEKTCFLCTCENKDTDQLRVYLISAFVFAIDFEVPIGPGAPCRGFL